MRGKFWINSIAVTVLGTAGLIQLTQAQPAPPASPAASPAATADPLAQAVSVLSSPRASADPRSAAAQRLIAIRSPQSRQAVHDILLDARLPQSQVAVAQALADDPQPDRDPSYVDPLFAMLSAPGATGLKAAQALGIYKTGPYHDDVLNRLRENAVGSVRTSDAARRAAIIGLGQMVDQSAAAILMQLLMSNSEGPEIHRVAAEALTALSGDTRIGDDAQGWVQWWAVNQIKAPPEFRSELLANQATQLNALKRRYGDLASDFRQFLDDEYHNISLDNRAGLGARGEKLKSYLINSNPVVRAEGALIVFNDKTLGVQLPPVAQGLLQPMIGDSDAQVRLAVANALAVLNDHTALQPLIDQLRREQDPQVRAALARALGQIGDVQAINTLLPLLDDGSLVVATSAARAIAGLGPQLQNVQVGQAREISQKLQRVLERANVPGTADLREQTIAAMAELRDPTLLLIFQKIVNNPNESPSIRQKAVKGIGYIGDPNTADLIGQGALRDPDTGVRGAAIDALPSVSGTAYADKLVEMQVPPNADDPVNQDKAWTALQSFLPSLNDTQLQDIADRFAQDAPQKRVVVLTAILDHQRKNDPKSVPVTLQNIGAVQMERLKEYETAAGNFDAAIAASAEKPDSVTMVHLTVSRTQALLGAGKYPEAAERAQEVLAKNPGEAIDIGTCFRSAAEALEQAGEFDKGVKLIEESETVPLTQPMQEELKSIKERLKAQIAKNKGNTYIIPSPVQINANNGETAATDH